MGAPRYTREIMTADEAIKMAVKIFPDNNQVVVLSDDSINFAATLDPRAAHQLGQALVQASRIAAMNILDPAPQRTDR
jgi:hypothetical protein